MKTPLVVAIDCDRLKPTDITWLFYDKSVTIIAVANSKKRLPKLTDSSCRIGWAVPAIRQMTDFFIIYEVGRLFERIKSKEEDPPDFALVSCDKALCAGFKYICEYNGANSRVFDDLRGLATYLSHHPHPHPLNKANV
ncbi:hypothetical protein AB4143_05170 [Vibrio breoganii]